MPSVLERLRKALAPGITVERELASGGMGTVYLGHDTVLDRPVAIKTLKMELARAAEFERFLREARAAAQLQHPGIVTVHHTGRTPCGIPYYIMDFVTGGTLKDRLAVGRLPAREVVAIGIQILEALGAAHHRNIVHRDIKPGNILLDDGRPKIGDFGVARLLDLTGTDLTDPGKPVGTLLYMAPEQLSPDGQVTNQTDLYAVGLVLFEASCGRRFEARIDPAKADWSGVPRHLRRVLRRALELEPRRRWPDAGSFAQGLASAELHSRVMRMAVVAAAIVGAAAVYWLPHPASQPPSDLVIFPFMTAGVADTSLGSQLAGLTEWYFDRLPRVRLASRRQAFREWTASPVAETQRLRELTRKLRSRYGLWGVVRARGSALVAELLVVNAEGESEPMEAVTSDSAHWVELGDSIGLRVVRKVFSKFAPQYEKAPAMARVNPAAIPDFFQGEYASRRNAWARAERYYAQALALDSTFVLAAWRLGTARRWMPWTGGSPFPPGFYALYQAYGDNLPAVDQELIKAQFASSGEARFAQYEAALAAAPDDPFAPLLYGDELFHRGPLAGHSLTEALAMLRESIARDSTMAPAWEHLAWAHIRMGQRDSARLALDTLRQVAGPAEEGDIHLPDLLQVAFGFRFPGRSQSPDPGPLRSPAVLPLAARGALAFDLPELQLELGRTLAGLPKASPATRGNGHVAQAVALVSLGRPMAALAHFDSAATLFGSDEARLQAAEWRVVPPALGSPGYSSIEVDRGRAMLAALLAEPALVARAGWALALDALSRGDTTGARGYQVRTNPAPRPDRPLALLLQAWQAAAAGRYDDAIAISAPALGFDSAGAAPDPFLRSALHLKRGEWFQATQRPDLTDRSWIWYEALDLVGWPHAEAQAGEVDWALAPWTRWRRGRLALSQGRRAEGCDHFKRVLALWTGAEEGLAPMVKEAHDRARGCSADE